MWTSEGVTLSESGENSPACFITLNSQQLDNEVPPPFVAHYLYARDVAVASGRRGGTPRRGATVGGFAMPPSFGASRGGGGHDARPARLGHRCPMPTARSRISARLARVLAIVLRGRVGLLSRRVLVLRRRDDRVRPLLLRRMRRRPPRSRRGRRRERKPPALQGARRRSAEVRRLERRARARHEEPSEDLTPRQVLHGAERREGAQRGPGVPRQSRVRHPARSAEEGQVHA